MHNPNWQPVPPALGDHVTVRWNKMALYCYLSDRDCGNCQMAEFNRRWEGPNALMHSEHPNQRLGCKMPMAVQVLLDRGTPVGKKAGRPKLEG